MKKSQIIALVKEIMQEQSATGGGVAGASFTPGVGMNYATPFAFSKKGVKNRATKYQEKMGWTVVKKKKDHIAPNL